LGVTDQSKKKTQSQKIERKRRSKAIALRTGGKEVNGRSKGTVSLKNLGGAGRDTIVIGGWTLGC